MNEKLKMNSEVCKKCKYVVWIVGLGQGIRCNYYENQKYKKKGDNELPVIISNVPIGCNFLEISNEICKYNN